MNTYSTKKLGEVCDILDNLRKPITKRDREFGPYPYYGATGIQDHVAGYIFDEDLILVGEDGARWGAGENSAYKISGKSWVNNHAHVLRPHRDILLDDWLVYYLNISDLSEYITGTTVKKLNQAKLRSIPIPLPPLAEQKKIVARLEGLLTKIKEAKRLRAEAQSAAPNLLPAELHKIFEDGKKKGWEEKTIDQISENLDAKRVPITKSVRESGKYPYYGASGIVDHVNDYIFDESLLLISEDGANLFARVTPIAFSVSGKVWVNNHAHVLKFSELVTQRFVEYHVNSIDISEFITGSAQPKLNQGRLNRIKIPLPPVAEQKKIVARLDSLSEKIRRLQEYQKSTASDFISLEQSILSKSFQ